MINQKPKYSTEKLLKKKKLRRYWRIALTVSFLIVVLYGLSFWSNHKSIEITEVIISGNKFTSTEKIEEIFNDSVSGKYLFVIAKKNFLLMPRKAIEKKIERELAVQSASVDTTELVTAEIKIVEHDPWGIWCDENFVSEEGEFNGCYLINDNGQAFVKAPDLIVEDLISLRRNLTAEKIEKIKKIESADELGDVEEIKSIHDPEALGSFYAEEKVFEKLVIITELLKRINIAIRSISTEDLETFRMTTKSGPVILVDKMDDPVEIVNNLKTTLEQESIHEIQFKNLEYIDLRFEGKAYYKIK